MAIALYIFIILAFFHFYFQTNIRKLFLALEESKLYDLELRLDEFKKKNTISPILYVGFKTLFRYSHELMSAEVGIETYIATNNFPKQTTGSNSLSSVLERNKNFEIFDLYKEWETIMKDAVKVNYYAWYIYLLPLIAFNGIKKLTFDKGNKHFQSWYANLTIPTELIQTMGTIP
jgi:hypothetical protein